MLSIIVPTIRTDKWRQLYDSICISTVNDFELILIGPRYSPVLEEYKNVRFIQDYGSPNRAQQIGLCNAVGDYVIAAADDCIFETESLDKCMGLITDSNDVVVAKYSEGGPELQQDDYYQLNKAYPYSSKIPDSFVIFNCAIINRVLLNTLGGFDCRLQTTAFGHANLAWRAQFWPVKVKFYKDKLLHCEHGHSDHKPVEFTHVFEDTPMYKSIIDNDEDIRIDINNWQKSDPVWSKR